MSALGGRLVGKPDLIVRSGELHWVIDYKTGGVLDYGTDAPKSAYVQQLQLYAVLEHERTGSWPESAYLLPFKQKTVEVPIESCVCQALADRLAEALDAYNDQAPGPQPASPDPETCRWCSSACDCDDVWVVSDESWGDEVLLAAGDVVQVGESRIGTTTLVLDLSGGTLGDNRIAIRGAGTAIAAVGSITSGSEIRAAGLLRKGDRTFNLAPWGDLKVVRA